MAESNSGFLKRETTVLQSVQETETLRKNTSFSRIPILYFGWPLDCGHQSMTVYTNCLSELKTHIRAYPHKIPTQRVGKNITGNFVTVQHLVPMLSLDNSYNSDDLKDFDRKTKQATGLQQITYWWNPSLTAKYFADIWKWFLVRGATRGNGIEGDDIK